MTFRQVPKEDLSVQAPPEVSGAVRLLAFQSKRSISETATELLCVALGLDPRPFGIKPTVRRRRNRAS